MDKELQRLEGKLDDALNRIGALEKRVGDLNNAIIHFYRKEAADKVVLKSDETERNLGMKPHTCRVCGAKGEFKSFLAREMMQNKRDEFEYFECAECGCLQIAEVPDNLGDYYGEGYYSFSCIREEENREYKTPVSHEEKILDVGCGSGYWLVNLADSGYGNLYGCDPFLEKDIHYGDRVHIKKSSIHDMDGKGTFDLVHMGDSFEHVTDPLETLQSAASLIKKSGLVEMSLPTYPNIAFELFGTHWYQLDAPRHIFLHSRKSIEYLAEKAGLEVLNYEYNSNESQILRSFFYKHGVPFTDINWELINRFFDSEQIEEFKEKAAECNKNGYGDHMIVRLGLKEQK